MNNSEFQTYTTKVNELVERVDTMTDSEARTLALEILQAIMDLHGAGLARVIELLSRESNEGRASLKKLTEDPLVCGLLVLYGIHPNTAEERVSRAIEKIRPQLGKYGSVAELVEIHESVVRLRLQTKGASLEKVKRVIKQAVLEAAPELTEIVIDGLASTSFVPLDMIQTALKEENTYEKSAAGH
jgi:Fe-S cluster biogenesis protein NfuA